MPDGHLGQHTLNKMQGRVTHAPAQTAGAKPSTFAAKCHQHRVPAAATAKLEAAMLHEAALQVSLELVVHELR